MILDLPTLVSWARDRPSINIGSLVPELSLEGICYYRRIFHSINTTIVFSCLNKSLLSAILVELRPHNLLSLLSRRPANTSTVVRASPASPAVPIEFL